MAAPPPTHDLSTPLLSSIIPDTNPRAMQTARQRSARQYITIHANGRGPPRRNRPIEPPASAAGSAERLVPSAA
jgi:hypothetical protein